MRPLLILLVALTAARFVVAQGTQPFDLALAGQRHLCDIPFPIHPYVSFLDRSVERPTDVRFIAAAGSGRVYALVNPRARIVEIRADLTRTPVFSGIDGVIGLSFLADAAGNIYLTTSDSRVLAIRPDGSIRAEFALDVATMDLAADQCTLFYESISSSNTIRRFDVCNGAPLPDFASLPALGDLVVLPDGGLLASSVQSETDIAIRRYDSAGTLTRTYPLTDVPQALALGRAGASMLLSSACNANIREYDLASGTLLRTVPLDVEFVDQIVAYTGFTAALGPLASAHVAEAVPSLSASMLVLLGALLVLMAVRRL